jgi:CubicO group peptidase (beta-lactamase class C family)
MKSVDNLFDKYRGGQVNAFCFVGAFGQLLMIEPEKELVLYVHSTGPKSGSVNHWVSLMWEAYKTD